MRWVLITLLALTALPSTSAAEDLPPELQDVDVVERLGASVPMDLTFVDATGATVRLGDYFSDDVPVLLTLNYYECPMLCGLQLNALVDSLREIDWTPGQEFRIVTISIDPEEGPALAAQKEQAYLAELYREGASWTFLTGDEASIVAIAQAVGFGYNYVPDQDEYAHPASLTFVSPNGLISRYLFGLMYEPRDLRFALLEAADGKVGSPVEHFILSCFVYDPETGGYVQNAMFIMRAGCALTLLILSTVLLVLWRRERNPVPEMV